MKNQKSSEDQLSIKFEKLHFGDILASFSRLLQNKILNQF